MLTNKNTDENTSVTQSKDTYISSLISRQNSPHIWNSHHRGSVLNLSVAVQEFVWQQRENVEET